MEDKIVISDKKMAKRSRRAIKAFLMHEEEALSTIYEAWDLVEELFHAHTKVKAVHGHFIKEIKCTGRIA